MIPRRFFWMLDFAVITAAFCLSYAIWPALHDLLLHIRVQSLPPVLHPEPATGMLPPFTRITPMLVAGGVAALLVLEFLEAYRPLLQQTRARVVVYSIAAPLGAAGVITLLLFFDKQIGWSRLFVLSFIALAALALCTFRMSLRHYFLRRREAGFYTKKVLLVGPREGARWLVKYFADNIATTEYTLNAFLGIPDDPDHGDTGVPAIGNASDLGSTLITHPVDEVIAVQSHGSTDWLPSVIETCDELGILLRIIPQALLFGKMRKLQMLYPYQILHLPAVVLTPPHFDSDSLFFKRAFDIVVSAALLTLLSPLFLIVAIVIKLTDRKLPVFYRWNVVGRNGTRFTGYKFTTMYSDADDRRGELLEKNEMTGPVFKIHDDPRVTPLGRFLRKFSLNELPQLWSVLKGDMSLVGPRPAFPHELDGYGFWHKRKLSIRPGITCLWQVRGRNKISNFDDWVKMDLEYIDNWSLWLDFKILVRTAWTVLAGTGS